MIKKISGECLITNGEFRLEGFNYNIESKINIEGGTVSYKGIVSMLDGKFKDDDRMLSFLNKLNSYLTYNEEKVLTNNNSEKLMKLIENFIE